MLERAKKQGIGRKSVADVMKVAEEDMRSLSNFLADKPFLHGDRMSTVSSLVLSRCTANCLRTCVAFTGRLCSVRPPQSSVVRSLPVPSEEVHRRRVSEPRCSHTAHQGQVLAGLG